MSLLPSTLLNSTQNEDQTLEIHSEILEPLSHSQVITRWEIPHKNILDSDSVLIWKVFCDGQATDRTSAVFCAKPYPLSGLYDTMLRARLFVNGKVISELNEVGKYLGMKYHFQPHEVKTELQDYFSYADNNIVNNGGKLDLNMGRIARTPNDKELGPQVKAVGHDYQVECSLKLHQLFAILKDAQLDTNNIEGKIMIEIDWSPKNSDLNKDNVVYAGSGVINANKKLVISEPRLILDFLTYNAEVQAQIKNTIWGDGAGINMPFREVALVRKTIDASGASKRSDDYSIGMTGRAIQKIWVAKVMDCDGNDGPNGFLGEVRSDLLTGQEWNVRVNDLMVYDRDVSNRAEEFNYLQQTGEAQYTIPPAMFEKRHAEINAGYVADDNIWNDTQTILKQNATDADEPTGFTHPVNVPADPMGDHVGQLSRVVQGASNTKTNAQRQLQGRMNYLGINLARYKGGGESPLNAMRIGSTPIIFSLTRDGTNDANTTQKTGTAYFWVEYLKMMNLRKGQISVMDM